MSDNQDAVQRYLDAVEKSRDARAPAWLTALRRRGTEQFAAHGFPTLNDEAWKYTDTAPILRAAFAPAAADATVTAAQVDKFWFSTLPAHRLVFINGYYAPTLSSAEFLPKGATVTNLAAAINDDPDTVGAHLGSIAPDDAHGFAALNASLWTDGAYIHLARGVEVDRPIHLLFVGAPPEGGAMALPRSLIVAEENTRATVIENYVAAGTEERYLTNGITEIFTAAGANLDHYRLQEETDAAYHVGGMHVNMGRDSRFTAHGIDLGGRLVRNEVRSLLAAPGAECVLNGLYIASGRRHVDNYTHIDHAQPHGTSREYYKGILDDRGRSVFHGRVVVHPGAQQSDAQQTNNNLLLSRDAEADTKPQLEIYADDVKCSHGATVGQLDTDEVFYLRSRGLSEAQSRDLLTYAFAKDVLNRLGLAPVRAQLEHHLISGLLRGRGIGELELV